MGFEYNQHSYNYIIIYRPVHFAIFQGKIQKHQTFEAELAAHSNAIHTLKSTGKSMIDQQHFASTQMRVSRRKN